MDARNFSSRRIWQLAIFLLGSLLLIGLWQAYSPLLPGIGGLHVE